MHVSLNEIEAEVRKAARGAGLAWGHAEEAGKAARWLSARCVVMQAIADVLEAHAAGRLGARIGVSGGAWCGGDKLLSPFVAGPAIADHAFVLAKGGAIELAAVSWPILLAPFAASAARLIGAPIVLELDSSRISIIARGASGAALKTLSCIATVVRVVIVPSRDGAGTRPAEPAWTGVDIEPDVWCRINRLARRTYVPASLVSRERGAGAGAIDND